MKFFLDTEFIEAPGHLDLLSIAIVCEDGREWYAINREADITRANPWVRQHVMPTILGEWSQFAITKAEMRQEILALIPARPDGQPSSEYEKPEIWGYFADYDWVLFCWIFGAMIDLPHGYPMYCRDLKQLADHLGVALPAQAKDGEHHALVDARWMLNSWLWVQDKVPTSTVVEYDHKHVKRTAAEESSLDAYYAGQHE